MCLRAFYAFLLFGTVLVYYAAILGHDIQESKGKINKNKTAKFVYHCQFVTLQLEMQQSTIQN